MKVAKLLIKGEDVASLVGLLQQRLESADRHYHAHLYASGSVAVLACEKFFLRNTSALLSVAILDFRVERTCSVELISGGGGAGMLDLNWGAERSRNKELVAFIEGICQQKSWLLETVQAP